MHQTWGNSNSKDYKIQVIVLVIVIGNWVMVIVIDSEVIVLVIVIVKGNWVMVIVIDSEVIVIVLVIVIGNCNSNRQSNNSISNSNSNR